MSTEIDSNLQSELQKQGIWVTSMQELYNWGRKNSIWPLQFGLACCAIEMIATAASKYDLARFGGEVFRPSPRQADLMIVAGTVTKKMAPQIVRLYNQMPDPKYVIAMGACAISGGPFKQGYNVLKGIDRYIPVDVYIPGCPPRPEALLHAFMELQRKIDGQKLTGEMKAAHLDRDAAQRVSGAGLRCARPRAAVESGGLPSAGGRACLTNGVARGNQGARGSGGARCADRSHRESWPGQSAFAFAELGARAAGRAFPARRSRLAPRLLLERDRGRLAGAQGEADGKSEAGRRRRGEGSRASDGGDDPWPPRGGLPSLLHRL